MPYGHLIAATVRPWVYVKVIHQLKAFSILTSMLGGPSAIAELLVTSGKNCNFAY